jgi:putative transposase
VEIDGEDGHVHLLVGYPPKLSVSSLVNSLKGPQGCFQSLAAPAAPRHPHRYWKGVRWSPSYFACSCGGAPISIVRQYIEQQKTSG